MSAGLILIITFALAACMGVPIGYGLGIATIAAALITGNMGMDMMIQTLYTANDSFPLLAIPFFILAGDIMISGGISKRLVNLGRSCLGHIEGSLAIITAAVCLLFAAISGSASATAAAIGGIMIPAMIKEGYDDSFACSITASAAAMGPVIPPSLSFIMYAIIAGVSITDLFMAGLFPGILVGVLLMIYSYFVCKSKKYGEPQPKAPIKKRLKALNEAKFSILVPVIILGGIYGGIFTPTEAAVVACVYGIVVGFAYKELTFKKLMQIFSKSALSTGMVMALLGCATCLGRLLVIEGIPSAIANFILSITDNKIIILLVINILLLIVGMFMETISAIIVFSPLLLAIAAPLGVDPIHLGVIIAVNLAIGVCTPPVGINMFVVSGISKVSIEKMIKPIIGCCIVMFLGLLLITYIPAISLWLPGILR